MRAVAVVSVWVVLLVVLVAVLVRIMGASLGTITSWWRSPWHNAAVGGLGGSAHLLGWAVDITPATPDVEAQARAIFPVVVNEGDHIHAAVFKA